MMMRMRETMMRETMIGEAMMMMMMMMMRGMINDRDCLPFGCDSGCGWLFPFLCTPGQSK